MHPGEADEPELIDHVLLHVRDALAVDARVGELGLDVEVEGELVVVRGAVSTDDRKQRVVDVVVEVLRLHGCDRAVHDGTVVPAPLPPVDEPEAV